MIKAPLASPLALALALPVLLSACATIVPPSPFAYGKKGDLVDFRYSWSAEASAIPALARRFQADLDSTFRDTLAGATADRASAARDKRPFSGHQFAFDWTTAGNTPGLLSLKGAMSSFTGGAHGNRGNKALLWDRRTGRAIAPASLLAAPDKLDALLRPAYCTALSAERSRRRGTPTAATDLFGDCPTLGQLSLVPADTNHDRRFDTLRLIADPYVAGPWVEGDYVVDVPVTARFVTALKPMWRRDFAAR